MDRAIFGKNDIVLYTPDNIPAFRVNSGNGTSIQEKEYILNEESVDYFDIIIQPNDWKIKAYNEFIDIPSNTSFDFWLLFMPPVEADFQREKLTFTKGTISTLTVTFINPENNRTCIITAEYNGDRSIKFIRSGTMTTQYATLISHKITYKVLTNDAEVDAIYGYSSGGAKIGSYIKMQPSDGSANTSYQPLEFIIDEQSILKGNTFELIDPYDEEYANDSITGFKCLFDGIIMVGAQVCYTTGFNQNDITYTRIRNITQDFVVGSVARYRAITSNASQTVNIGAFPTHVHAGDIITVEVRNGTGNRGTVVGSSSNLFAIYVAPLLPGT